MIDFSAAVLYGIDITDVYDDAVADRATASHAWMVDRSVAVSQARTAGGGTSTIVNSTRNVAYLYGGNGSTAAVTHDPATTSGEDEALREALLVLGIDLPDRAPQWQLTVHVRAEAVA